MPKVMETKTINVDNVVYAVEKMSPQLQQMITMMDEWRQKDADLTVELTMVKAALRDIQNSIYVTINQEREEAMKKAKAMGLIQDEESAANEAGNQAQEPAGLTD